MSEQLPIWTFGFKKPPEPASSAQVAARDEREAVAVAMAWCAANNSRFFGWVRPFVVADPSILASVKAPEPQQARPMDTGIEQPLPGQGPGLAQKAVDSLRSLVR